MYSRRNTKEDVPDGIIIFTVSKIGNNSKDLKVTQWTVIAEKINELKLWERQTLNL